MTEKSTTGQCIVSLEGVLPGSVLHGVFAGKSIGENCATGKCIIIFYYWEVYIYTYTWEVYYLYYWDVNYRTVYYRKCAARSFCRDRAVYYRKCQQGKVLERFVLQKSLLLGGVLHCEVYYWEVYSWEVYSQAVHYRKCIAPKSIRGNYKQ
jgi:hypothetical protein